MDLKQDILQLLSPKAVLKAITPEAVTAVPNHQLEHGYIGIAHFPFQVGRESRTRGPDTAGKRIERIKRGGSNPNNDLYLTDAGQPLHISREHLSIRKTATGYELLDRCSACGTGVGQQRLGGHDCGGSTTLNDGDIIAIGAADTPYLFQFITL